MLLPLILCAIFYWFLYSFDGPPLPPEPSEAKPVPTEIPSFRTSANDANRVTVAATPGTAWNFSLPLPNYVWKNDRVVETDACFDSVDGSSVPAKGEALYRYLYDRGTFYRHAAAERANLLDSAPRRISPVRSFLNAYHFRCVDSSIEKLYACPPGEILLENDCVPVDACTGRADGTRFNDLQSSRKYYECLGQKATRKKCPEGHHFFQGECVETLELEKKSCYGKPDDTVFPLPPRKYMRCRANRAVVERCPYKEVILPTWNECRPSVCLGRKDGTFVPGPKTERDGLRYSTGSYFCSDQRPKFYEECPPFWWDPGAEEDLRHLPTVFDERLQKCTAPSLCRNVHVSSADANSAVPVHEFTKAVEKNWPEYASLFDSTVGIRCDHASGRKERFALEPGKRIVRNRIVDGCSGRDFDRIPVGDRRNAYFDCRSARVVACEGDRIFDGRECVEPIPHAHAYNGMPFFDLENVAEWFEFGIRPGDRKRTKRCRDGEVYLEDYDVCSDPKCEPYGFLSQIKLSVKLKIKTAGGFEECHEELGRLVVREYSLPPGTGLNFWSQRVVEKEDFKPRPRDRCEPGDRLQSGDFVMDSTLYKTCNDHQPFVFCPSSLSKKIVLADEERKLYACAIPETLKPKHHYNTYPPAFDVFLGETEYTQEIRKYSYVLPQHKVENHLQGFDPVLFGRIEN